MKRNFDLRKNILNINIDKHAKNVNIFPKNYFFKETPSLK